MARRSAPKCQVSPTILPFRGLAKTGASSRDAAHHAIGIALAATSLLVMPFLSWAQRRTGRALGSGSVIADSKQTLLCTYLSAVLLVGLVLNATLGWSWADPLAGLVIAAVALKEGVEAWRGDACCAPVPGRLDVACEACGEPGCSTARPDADI